MTKNTFKPNKNKQYREIQLCSIIIGTSVSCTEFPLHRFWTANWNGSFSELKGMGLRKSWEDVGRKCASVAASWMQWVRFYAKKCFGFYFHIQNMCLLWIVPNGTLRLKISEVSTPLIKCVRYPTLTHVIMSK